MEHIVVAGAFRCRRAASRRLARIRVVLLPPSEPRPVASARRVASVLPARELTFASNAVALFAPGKEALPSSQRGAGSFFGFDLRSGPREKKGRRRDWCRAKRCSGSGVKNAW